MSIGFTIHPRPRKVDDATVARFKAIAVANISDSMNRMAHGGPRLRPLHAGGVLAGAALTVRQRPGDNLMVHAALNRAGPGDVLVVDAGGDLTNAIMGELMLAHAQQIGVAGVIVNGAVRDSGWIRANALPVFAAGITHRGPYKNGPGEVNATIALDGMVIRPGDLIVGDDDGVVCVPIEQADEVYAAASRKQAGEADTMAAIKAGTVDRSWVERALRDAGCEGV
ncbi:4-hydroxy-4-methyl-2-oxoglutarate aldolase/4-carboxy-4-hydroxy-2-oxoadipate aldolase [Methylobacterium crusticola]|uniref:Putative 4-hydroxy-4-methyl-2-oxoglutarate aldolase n=1 Tax=Methylobacterium crusticola TaxID=1697972 RepID=A0ABQ4R4Y6_9HYPH|nr:RraA family protein [Methylobacterium crusticola]GJD52763.1 4-hydroxy-4-methyl-2-oxoglutarate aldolase/4-carboxy-4-hydroxy-2-oxoadipate aldolase [Methylobacterium crusticola]